MASAPAALGGAPDADGSDGWLATRRKQPGRLLFTDLIVKFPCIVLLLFLAPCAYLSMLGLTMHPLTFDVGVNNFQILASHFSQQRERVLHKAIADENNHAQVAGRRLQHWIAPHAGDQSDWVPPRDHVLDRVELVMFYNDQRDIMTPEGLTRAREVERAIEQLPGYSEFCVTDNAVFGVGVCAPPTSITTYFFPSVKPNSTELVYDGRGPAVVDLEGTRSAIAAKSDLHWFLSFSDTWTSSTLLRAEFVFAQDHVISPADRCVYNRLVP